MHRTWFHSNPVQATSFVVLVVGIPLFFLIMSRIQRLRHPPRQLHVPAPRRRILGPTPRMWDVHVPGPGGGQVGSWEDVQPLSARRDGNLSPKPTSPTSPTGPDVGPLDIVVLIAMPSPAPRYTEYIPVVALGTAGARITRRPGYITN